MRSRAIVFLFFVVLMTNAGHGVPPLMNYQGYIRVEATHAPLEGTFPVTFRIYPDSTTESALWTETHPGVVVNAGLFNVLLGSIESLPESLFTGASLWLATTVLDSLSTPRRPLVTVPYSFHARTADVAMFGNARDTYHEIVDLMPNTSVRTFIVPRRPNSRTTLYLHGEGFGGTLLAHTHDGHNIHDHGFSGTTANANADHGHSFTTTTGAESNDHAHSGTTVAIDLAHAHSGTTADAGSHRHDLVVDGLPGNGNFLVHGGEVNTLSASDTGDRRLWQSISTAATIGPGPIHSHTFTTAVSLGSHAHAFSTGGVSAPHTHFVSGVTQATGGNHAHTFSGVTASSGNGLALAGVAAGTFPSQVFVYVDGSQAPVAGPYSGQFASGMIDLSAFIVDDQEHVIEIVESGGTGGRIVYTIFVQEVAFGP